MLNCIASFDEMTFRIFGFLINSSIRLYEVNIFPAFDSKKAVQINGETHTLNQIFYRLNHLNLIKYGSDGYIDMSGTNEKFTYLRYGKRLLQMRYPHSIVPSHYQIGMHYFTKLGNDIAKLYVRDTNALGNEFFDAFLAEARAKGYIYSEIEMPDTLYEELGN